MAARTKAPVSLESGDHLTCDELHRRYSARPDIKEAYRRNGVREHVVWRVQDEAIDWFHLQDGQYVLVGPGDDGLIESEQFSGLTLHVPSMLSGDLSAVLARVRHP
jgi:hypothetical protein